MEQQMAMLSLVVGGVAERHPSLRVAHLESGAGWLPYWAWRLDETVEIQRRPFPELALKPSEYVQRQFFVSIDTDEVPGIAAIDLFDEPHVTWGSDYPHGDGKFPNAVKTLASIPGMTPAKFRSVVAEAPMRLFGHRLATVVASS
jgi:predicted TIM-barrel fold metal-dependent hydrolase